MLKRILLFLLLNFGALAIGGLFTGTGVSSTWYWELRQAPWTPPGWVFGAAWTVIMLCFSVYMARVWGKMADNKERAALRQLYGVQWVLNVSWNAVFFYYHQVFMGLLVIVALTVLVGYLLYRYRTQGVGTALFIVPYVVWLLIATSLNAYIFIYN